MLTLFSNNDRNISQGLSIAPDWPYIRAGINKELEKVITYLKGSSLATKSNHFLVRLLQNIAVPVGIDTERYYANVDAIALNLSMALGMTSSINRGRFFENIFYGDKSREILIAVDTEFDFQKVHDDWENVSAVEVLRHDLSDMALNPPDGKNNWSKDGLAVISVNITMLAVQYRAFLLQEKYYYDLTGESPRSVTQFLARYVIPNMLYSHLDQVLVNRFSNLLNNKPMSFPLHKLPFYITPFEQRLDKAQKTYMQYLLDRNRDMTAMMQQLPLISKLSLKEFSLLPELAPTMQVNWALLVSRLPILDLLVDLGQKHMLRKSRSDLNEIKRTIRLYRNMYLLENMLPKDLLIDANNTMERLQFMAET